MMLLNCGVGETLRSSLRSPAEGEGNEGFPPPPNKDLDAGKDCGQEENGATEDELVEWHL